MIDAKRLIDIVDGPTIGFITAWRILAHNREDYGGTMPTDEEIEAVLIRDGIPNEIGYLFDRVQDTLYDAGLLKSEGVEPGGTDDGSR